MSSTNPPTMAAATPATLRQVQCRHQLPLILTWPRPGPLATPEPRPRPPPPLPSPWPTPAEPAAVAVLVPPACLPGRAPPGRGEVLGRRAGPAARPGLAGQRV